MSTRSRTKEYVQIRARQVHSPRPEGGQLLVEDDVRLDMEHTLAPEWVDVVDSIHNEFKLLKQDMKDLTALHNKRLKVKFNDDETETELQIERKTQDMTHKLRKCENGLKQIATVGNVRGGQGLSQQERSVRLNVMRNLGNVLQSLSKDFRQKQKDFLMRMKGQEGIGNEYFDDGKDISFEDKLDRGLTAEEQENLQVQHQNADQRHQEIIKIAQSINELATLFRELNVLVIEQGTILDRIDYNLEQTCVKVKSGTAELVKANNYSKKNRSMKCIMFLTLISIILLVILIAKHSSSSSSSEDKP